MDIVSSVSFSVLRPQQCRLTPSFSLPDGLGTFGSIWSPNLLSGSLLEHIQTHHPKTSTFITAFKALRVQFSHLKRRIYAMETENNELKHANMVLRSDSQALEQELSNFRADYYAERFQSKVRVQCARADKDKIAILSDKLKQAEDFIMAMVDIKLHEPVLGRAAEAVREGAEAEEALIDAVRVAATKKGSAWSRIIPAIVGPRSPEHYLSAIKLVLMLQKDLREREKVSNFWKMIAKSDSVNANTITPSSSLLSEVSGQDAEHSMSEQAVLDEMIALLANGNTLTKKIKPVVAYSTEVVSVPEDKALERPVASIPIPDLSSIRPDLAPCEKLTSQISSLPTSKEYSTQPFMKSPKTVNTTEVRPPKHITQIPISPTRSKAKASQIVQSKLPSPVSPPKIITSISPAKPVSPPKLSSKQPTTPVRKVPLTPIRSRLSTPRTNTFKRPVLTSIDLNRPLQKMDIAKGFTKPAAPLNIPDDTIKKKPTKDQPKDLTKRRGVIMEEVAHSRPSIVAESQNQNTTPMTAEIENYEPRAPPLPTCVVHAKITEANNPASNPMHISPTSPTNKEPSSHCTEPDMSENIKHGSLLAAQALQSLERICAAFSSDTLGSLEMSDAGTDDDDASQSDVRFECSMASASNLIEDADDADGHLVSHSPRPPTPIVKCSTWASSIPRQRMSSTSAASSSSSSSSESILNPVTPRSKQLDGSLTPARKPILALSRPSPTDRFAKSLKDTFYKAVPPSQNPSLLPTKQITSNNNGFQQPLPPSQNKPSIFLHVLDRKSATFESSTAASHCKPRSHTINTVSSLLPTLSIPRPETLSVTSPFKPRSNTVNTISPISSTHHRLVSSTKPRSNTITTTEPVSRSHTAKTISSSAKRRSNTLDSYLQVPSKIAKSPVRTKVVSSEDNTAPTAAFMRRPDVKTTPVNTRRMTNSAAPLIPNWSPALNSGALSQTQYRNMLRGGGNMVIR